MDKKENQISIGCHLSSVKGYLNMGEEALKIGADTFQFFTRNPRGGKAKDIDEKDVADFLKFLKENEFNKLVAHAPYTLNPCSATPKVKDFAAFALEDDLQRMEHTPGNYYNFHPGSHVGQGTERGIELIANLLNKIIKKNQNTIVLLETMTGKGTEIGGKFEELKAIIDRVEIKEKIGVCLDTCHVWDGGYDIVNDLEGVLGQFDEIIGLDNLHAIHVNDSKNPLGAKKDRHAKIGEGYIGEEAIRKLVHHEKLRNKVFVLETPNEIEGYAKEIQMLKNIST